MHWYHVKMTSQNASTFQDQSCKRYNSISVLYTALKAADNRVFLHPGDLGWPKGYVFEPARLRVHFECLFSSLCILGVTLWGYHAKRRAIDWLTLKWHSSGQQPSSKVLPNFVLSMGSTLLLTIPLGELRYKKKTSHFHIHLSMTALDGSPRYTVAKYLSD